MNLSARSDSGACDAEQAIRELAAEHGIAPSREGIDDWMDKISSLSGEDEDRADDVEQLLVLLRRAKLVDPEEARDLHARYLREKFGYR